MPTFKAIVVEKSEGGQKVGLADFDEANLMDGDVTVRVEWSTVNYKDGLALTGKAPVVRRFPMIPGIDFAGTVESSSHPQWKPGDRVILNGWGAGETHLGGYAEKARVKGDWLVPLPARNSARGAMAIGTAGYTAMLAVMALERHGVTPRQGAVIVTGAAGGVGSVAVSLLAKLGFAVIASTGRPAEADYLKSLGAHEIIERKELAGASRPLGPERWAGGIDTVGSTTLASVLSMTSLWRGHRRLRIGRRDGSADDGRAVHSAWSVADRHRFRDVSAGAAAGSLEAAGVRYRGRQARRDDQ